MKTSVLINSYNRSAYLAACIESVLEQTHPADEIIVYDDGSSDESCAIVQRYAPRVQLIAGSRHARPNRINQGHAIHEAFLRSTGELIFLLDGDDVFAPTKLERFINARHQAPSAVLFQSPVRRIDEAGKTLPRIREPLKQADDPLATIYARHDVDLFYPTSALAFSRAFLEKALPLDWSDDVDLWTDVRLCLLAVVNGPVVTLDDELTEWRQYPSSESAQRARARSYLLGLTWERTKLFNRFARARGLPSISVWRNPRFYLQLLRLLAPSTFYELYRRWTSGLRAVPVPQLPRA